jgi:hypothetical protein
MKRRKRDLRGWREVSTLSEMLKFCAGKEIAHETDFSGLVEFADGSALYCQAENRGFGGSEMTPPDPPEVVWYVIEKYKGWCP